MCQEMNMKKSLILVLFVSNLSHGQQHYQLTFDQYNRSQNFDWRGLEEYNSYLVKQEFKEYAKANDLLAVEINFIEVSNYNGGLINHLKAIDINNDSQADIIYRGPSGGEPYLFKIFINQNGRFNKVFETMQGVVKVEWEDERLSKIYAHDWGCCAEIRVINRVFDVEYNNNIPSIKQVFESVEVERMSKPIQFFKQPKEFKILNENYRLRMDPWIDDESIQFTDDYTERLGNTIGLLHKGQTGTAYAFRKDETGREWWYVTIKSNELKDSVIYNEDLVDNVVHVGWLSSRYVEEY